MNTALHSHRDEVDAPVTTKAVRHFYIFQVAILVFFVVGPRIAVILFQAMFFAVFIRFSRYLFDVSSLADLIDKLVAIEWFAFLKKLNTKRISQSC